MCLKFYIENIFLSIPEARTYLLLFLWKIFLEGRIALLKLKYTLINKKTFFFFQIYGVTGGFWVDCHCLDEKKKKTLILLCKLHTQTLYGYSFSNYGLLKANRKGTQVENRPDSKT